MIKQRKYYQTKIFLLKNFNKYLPKTLLLKSLRENHKQASEVRLEHYKTIYINKVEKRFFLSYMKLRCTLTHSKSVPSSRLLLSRYALNKYANSLTLGFYSKSFK